MLWSSQFFSRWKLSSCCTAARPYLLKDYTQTHRARFRQQRLSTGGWRIDSTALGIDRKGVAPSAHKVDDEPDNASQNEEGREQNQRADGLWNDGARAVDGGSFSEIGVARHHGNVTVDAGAFAEVEITQKNRRVSGEKANGAEPSTAPSAEPILAKGKHVVVIGGGDTGSDCIGTSFRQGALSVTNFEIMPQPPEHENKALTWPNWPLKLRTSSSHEEGAARDFAVATTKLSGENGAVKTLHCVRLDSKMQPVPDTEFEINADLVLLAMGFVHPVHEGLLKGLGLKLDQRGNVAASTDDYRTSVDKVFTAGDMRRGQSLVVWAIREGRQAAHAVDEFLMGSTELPR